MVDGRAILRGAHNTSPHIVRRISALISSIRLAKRIERLTDASRPLVLVDRYEIRVHGPRCPTQEFSRIGILALRVVACMKTESGEASDSGAAEPAGYHLWNHGASPHIYKAGNGSP